MRAVLAASGPRSTMPIKLSISSSDPLSTVADLAVVGVPEGAKVEEGFLAQLATALGPVVAKNLKRDEFTGKKDQVADFQTNGATKAARVVVMGLGKGPISDADVRVLAAKAARFALTVKASSLTVHLPQVAGAERAGAEGAILGAYRFTRYFTGDRLPKVDLDKVTLLTNEKVGKPQREAAALGEKIGNAICIARDLINEPPNELYPEKLADAAAKVCKDSGLACTVLDREALEKRGMKLIVAVGQGSARPPHFVHMTYKPKGKAKKRLVFVGKGLTFDTGGICIKPAPGMEEMKGDMGGAANVIAPHGGGRRDKAQVEVHGLIGCAENMPDGGRIAPATSSARSTARRSRSSTPTPRAASSSPTASPTAKSSSPTSCSTTPRSPAPASSPSAHGLRFYANNDELAERMKKAVKDAGEAMWHMPLVEELREGLKSDWADLKHTGRSLGRLDHRGPLPPRVRRRRPVDPRATSPAPRWRPRPTTSTPRAAPATASSPT
jgi:leucyl aminopeptidase